MEEKCEVSIIIPFNNGKKYLEKCLENINKLNYEKYEIILIDDFSEDRVEKIAKKYKKAKYYYTNEKTIGVGNARNLGIEKASGKYILFVDVDDTIDENLLLNMQKYMDENIEMIKFKMKIVNRKKVLKINGNTFEKTDGEKAFNRLCFNDKYLDSPCIYLIKKEVFDKTRFEKNMYHEDFGLIPQLIATSKSFVSTNFYGYNYNQTEDSIMRNNDYSKKIKKVEDKLKYYEILEKKMPLYNLKNNTKKNLLSYYTNSIIKSIKDLEKDDRKKFEKKIKNIGLLENIQYKNFRQFIKKLILISNIEIYFKLKER